MTHLTMMQPHWALDETLPGHHFMKGWVPFQRYFGLLVCPCRQAADSLPQIPADFISQGDPITAPANGKVLLYRVEKKTN